VNCREEKPYPYISLFKNIILDWYNSSRAWDNSGIVYRQYKDIYTKGISEDETTYLKHAFTNYRRESKYYNINMVYQVGQFEKIACRCRNISWNGMERR
jgi:hypothetical protein